VTLNRNDDWDIQLFNFIQDSQNTPFKWGEHDCALFTANAILAMTGEDLANDVRGRYTTFKGSLKVLKKLGKADLGQVVSAKLGASKLALLAKRGDVVLVNTNSTTALGMVAGLVALVPGKEGLEPIKMDDWIKAWTV